MHISVIMLAGLTAQLFASGPVTEFKMTSEVPLSDFGGIPFVYDLDGNPGNEILWLQSPGIFHSRVFDNGPWKGRIREDERVHFCLTATTPDGKILWQIGSPWKGDRPFLTHCGERGLDCADIDGDGTVEVICVRRQEILIINGQSGEIEKSITAPADNAQIVRIAHTGKGAKDWTILVKNSESSYAPHEYANPCWFYDAELTLIKSADYLGAGHAPLVHDIDEDGFDEFLIGFNAIDHNLETIWTYPPVPKSEWDAAEMHVDSIALGEIDGQHCIALAASEMEYLLNAETGDLIWKREGIHPQFCAVGNFMPEKKGLEVIVHNKRSDLQIYDSQGNECLHLTPPINFPLGQAEPCKRQAFHTFDPLTILRSGTQETADLAIFSDAGWPYVIAGSARKSEFPYTQNMAQDWGEVPGRPDDYGYGFYVRIGDFSGDGKEEIMINDRRFAWFYTPRAGTGR